MDFFDRRWQRHDFYRVFACQTDLELSSTRTSIIAVKEHHRRPNFISVIAELHNNGIVL